MLPFFSALFIYSAEVTDPIELFMFYSVVGRRGYTLLMGFAGGKTESEREREKCILQHCNVPKKRPQISKA